MEEFEKTSIFEIFIDKRYPRGGLGAPAVSRAMITFGLSSASATIFGCLRPVGRESQSHPKPRILRIPT